MTKTSATSVSNKKLFCFGLGYTASYLLQPLMQDGWSIAGTVTSDDKREELKEEGIEAHLFDETHTLCNTEFIFKDVTHVLISIPPDSRGDLVFECYGEELAQLPNLEWLGYLSTIGVYGNRDGQWVDEKSQPCPTSKRGAQRLLAEQQWYDLFKQYNLPVHFFRLSGIYGPGRSALDTVRSGTARRIDKAGHAFNRIHIEDIIQILMASINAPQAGEVYNISDDNPAPSHEVIEYACHLLNMAVPPLISYEQVDLAPIVRSFYKDNKRIKNDKIKADLGVNLLYPDYKAGLRSCLDFELSIPELL